MPKVLPEYKQEAKKRIINGALKTFLRLGYKKTTMDDIGKDLGVSKGALYQYFTSKDDLFLETLDLFITQNRSKIIEYLKTEGIEGIKSEEFFNLSLFSSDITTNFAFDLVSESLYNERINKKLSAYYDRAINGLELFFEENKKNGLVKKTVDSRKTSIRLLGMREGLKSMMFYSCPPAEAKKVWMDFADSLLNEIR